MPEKAELALVATPLGLLVAKRGGRAWWKRALERGGLRATRAERAFENAPRLAAAGVTTAEALAWLQDGGDALLLTRYLEGVPLWEAARAGGGSALGELVPRLALSVARLHDAGFRHRDLKAPNLLVVGGSEDEPRLAVLDLDGLRRLGRAPTAEECQRDLGRLCASFASDAARAAGVTDADWADLLRRYVDARAECFSRPDEAAAWARQIAARAERKRERNRRRGRPLA